MPTDAPLSPMTLPKIAPSINSRNQFPANPDIPVINFSDNVVTGSIALNAMTIRAPASDTIAMCQFFQISAITQTIATINPKTPNIS